MSRWVLLLLLLLLLAACVLLECCMEAQTGGRVLVFLWRLRASAAGAWALLPPCSRCCRRCVAAVAADGLADMVCMVQEQLWRGARPQPTLPCRYAKPPAAPRVPSINTCMRPVLGLHLTKQAMIKKDKRAAAAGSNVLEVAGTQLTVPEF